MDLVLTTETEDELADETTDDGLILIANRQMYEEFSPLEYMENKRKAWKAELQVEHEIKLELEEKERRKKLGIHDKPIPRRTQEEELNERLLKEGVNALNPSLPRSKWMQQVSDEMDILKEDRRVKEIGYRLMCPITEDRNRLESEFFDEPLDVRHVICKTLPQTTLDEIIYPPATPWVGTHLLGTRISYAKTFVHLFQQNIGPSVCVVIDGTKQLFCHYLLLTLVSRVFARQQDTRMLYLPGCIISTEDFARAYRWMIEPLTTLSVRQLLELSKAAQYLEIDELHTQCWQLIYDLLKSLDKILGIYLGAKKVCGLLEKQLAPHVGRVWLPFAASLEFANLNYDKVFSFFKMDRLAVNTEIETLYSLVLWLDFDFPSRKCYAASLSKLIRFDLMPYIFLITLNKQVHDCEALNYLFDCPPIQRHLHDNIEKVQSYPDRYIGSIYNHKRQWIYDPDCKYHHGQSCNTFRFVGFDDFLDYMEHIQNSCSTYGQRIKPASDPDIVCCGLSNNTHFKLS